MDTTRRTFLAGLAATMAAPYVGGQQPPPQAGGPWEHDVMIRRSLDGGDSFGPAELFEDASGVPTLIADLRGRLVAAFQWFPANSPHFDRVAVKLSEDGGFGWSVPVPIVVLGLPAGYSRPFDPTLALLPDGRIRVYFSSNTTGSLQLGAGVATYSGLSEDGIHYVFEEGARFEVAGSPVIDPAVVRLGDLWHYTAPAGRPEAGAFHAVSRDGLGFERLPDIPSVGGVNWTGNLVAHGNGMRFYGTAGSNRRGAWWAQSEDGLAWTDPVFLGLDAGDPAVADTLTGERVMLYVS